MHLYTKLNYRYLYFQFLITFFQENSLKRCLKLAWAWVYKIIKEYSNLEANYIKFIEILFLPKHGLQLEKSYLKN